MEGTRLNYVASGKQESTSLPVGASPPENEVECLDQRLLATAILCLF